MTSVETDVRDWRHSSEGSGSRLARAAASRTATRSPASRSPTSRPAAGSTPRRRSPRLRRRPPAGRRRSRPSASASSWRRPTSSRRGATRSSRGSRARPAARSASACSRWGSSRAFSPGRGARLCAARAGDPLRPPGNAGDGDPQAGRRRRRDRALERRADPLGALDRGAARAREHRRAEAVRVVAVLGRPALGRDLRRGRACPRAR